MFTRHTARINKNTQPNQTLIKILYLIADKIIMSVKTWILLDSLTRIQSQPLSRDKLQMAVLKMPEKDWVRFYVWTEGWENWQSLKAFLESEQKDLLTQQNLANEETVRAVLAHNLDPELKKKKSVEEQINKSMTLVRGEETQTNFRIKGKDFDGNQLKKNNETAPPADIDFKKLNDNYRNRAERHELKIEVLLMTKNGKTFRSYSKNISLTGSLLEDNIPFDYYGTQFDVVVVNRYSSAPQLSRVQLKGETVGEGLTQRLRFLHANEAQKQKLANLLNDYIHNQNKKTG